MLVAYVPVMVKCSWEMLFFESEDTEVLKADRNKLFASNEEQIDNHTLLLDMLHSNMSVVCTLTIVEVYNFINIYGVAVVLCWSLM